MEQPLIVLVDAEQQCVHLYGEFNRSIPFEDIFILNCFMEGRKVYYIEQMSAVEGPEVVEVVTQLYTPPETYEKRYVRCLDEGYVRIPELKMTFAGPKDCKPLENYGYDIFERSPTLKKYLLQGRVEIMTETAVMALKKRRPDPKAKDKAYDAILLNKPVDQAMSESSMFDDPNLDEITDDDDVVSEAEAILRQHKDFGKK
jgi:hypothetical protein